MPSHVDVLPARPRLRRNLDRHRVIRPAVRIRQRARPVAVAPLLRADAAVQLTRWQRVREVRVGADERDARRCYARDDDGQREGKGKVEASAW